MPPLSNLPSTGRSSCCLPSFSALLCKGDKGQRHAPGCSFMASRASKPFPWGCAHVFGGSCYAAPCDLTVISLGGLPVPDCFVIRLLRFNSSCGDHARPGSDFRCQWFGPPGLFWESPRRCQFADWGVHPRTCLRCLTALNSTLIFRSRVRPRPSLDGSATAKAPGLRTSQRHCALRATSAIPLSAAWTKL
jgi:hypothetical protein